MAMAETLGITPGHLRKILLGTLYPDVPERLSEDDLRPKGNFTDEDVVAWRRRFSKPGCKTTMKAVAEIHGTFISAVARMLTGDTYAHLPGAISAERLAPKKIFQDRYVPGLRRAYRDCTMSMSEIARKHRTSAPTVERMLTGRTFSHISGALSADEMADRRREFVPAVVLFMRLSYGAPGVLVRHLAGGYGITTGAVADILTGRTYADVPGAVSLKREDCNPTSKLTEAAVLELRRRFKREHPRLTIKEIAVELGIADSNVLRILKGQSYPEVGEHVQPEFFHYGHRSLAPEVVLFMRLAYHPERVSCQKLATAYGLNVETVHRLLTGKSYRNIPGALMPEQMRRKGMPRRMSDEFVHHARRQFRTRWVTIQVLAKEAGVGIRAMEHAVRGYSYKNVPDAVPDHVQPLRVARYRMKSPPRKRPSRAVA